jgi:Icc-related predicted phosphoesterase
MRLVLISDTHGLHAQLPKLPDGDVLVHAGDLTDDAGQAALRSFLRWFNSQPHKRKVFIAGNHDWAFEKWNGPARAMVKELAPTADYLEDSGVEIDGVRFWGSPYQPEFYNWAFNRKRGAEISHHWDKIPNETDVLITHGPPKGILDISGIDNESCGCADLWTAVATRIRPKLHVFGHIHHGYGTFRQKWLCGTSQTTFINSSICNERYQPINKPWVFNL